MERENGAGSDVECLICFRELTPPFSGSDGCPHLFHYHCLTSWAASCEGNVPSCPHCRLPMPGWTNWLGTKPDEYLQIPPEDQRFFSELIAGVADPEDNNWLLENDGLAGLRADLGDPDFGDAGGEQLPQPDENPGAVGDENEPEPQPPAPAE